MINQELFDFVKQQNQSGIAKEVIVKELLSSGWTMQDINDAFNAITIPKPSEPAGINIPKNNEAGVSVNSSVNSFASLNPNIKTNYASVAQPAVDLSKTQNIVSEHNTFIPYSSKNIIPPIIKEKKHSGRKVFSTILILLIILILGIGAYAYFFRESFKNLPIINQFFIEEIPAVVESELENSEILNEPLAENIVEEKPEFSLSNILDSYVHYNFGAIAPIKILVAHSYGENIGMRCGYLLSLPIVDSPVNSSECNFIIFSDKEKEKNYFIKKWPSDDLVAKYPEMFNYERHYYLDNSLKIDSLLINPESPIVENKFSFKTLFKNGCAQEITYTWEGVIKNNDVEFSLKKEEKKSVDNC